MNSIQLLNNLIKESIKISMILPFLLTLKCEVGSKLQFLPLISCASYMEIHSITKH
jgi:hypothetical protein